MRLRPGLGGACTLVLTMALAACSTGGQHLTHSGFLGEASPLKRAPTHRNLADWISPSYRPSEFDAVLIEPVDWRAASKPAAVEASLEESFRAQLRHALGARYRLDRPGGAGLRRTLRVRSAITDIRKSRWYINAPVQVAEFAVGGFGLFAPLQGGASEELQVEDARTGEVLLQLATFHNGMPWDFAGAYIPYDHARAAFRQAADLVATLLVDPSSADRSAWALTPLEEPASLRQTCPSPDNVRFCRPPN